MNSELNNSRLLVITGMHRSGTSLATGWLQRCKLPVGEDLVPGDNSNPYGHFEDVAPLDLHRSALIASGVSEDGLGRKIASGKPIDSSENLKQGIRKFVKQNSTHAQWGQWGFKDPRTTLFLDVWKQEVPDAKFLFLVRGCAGVTHSLVRRHHKSSLNLRYVRKQALLWQRYNHELMVFIDRYPQDCLLLSINDLATHGPALIDHCNNKWGFSLQQSEFDAFYDPSVFHHSSPAILNAVLRLSLPSAQKTSRRLEAYREKSRKMLDNHA